ncbi:hypothetical protein BDB01DRAFT_802951 [Pilobolus umbonatus]|nr:hypothetical protein BDB01DRAFT_802951 [Pilobolus umbonatus]
MSESWDDFTFEEQCVRCLELPNHIIERICRFLPSRRDRYEACLVHRTWQPAAMSVLWENPRFDLPKNFRAFLIGIKTFRKNASLVKDIHLIFPDHEETEVFQNVVKRDINRHQPNNNPLADNQRYIKLFTELCDNLQSLTIYGWNISPSSLEQSLSLSKSLQSLCIIGYSKKEQLNLLPILSRLSSLKLDGDFKLNTQWAKTIVSRGVKITTLQISLTNVELDTLRILCSPHQLKLTSLTLTDTIHLNDDHVLTILKAFPTLTKLCLHGSPYLTFSTVNNILHYCPQIRDIEIRNQSSASPIRQQERLKTHHQSQLQRLVLESMNIIDHNADYLGIHCPQLHTLGLKDCPLVTQSFIATLIPHTRYLDCVHIIQCPNLDFSGFEALSEYPVCEKIKEIKYQSSGAITPNEVFNVCAATSPYAIKRLVVIGYEDIYESSIGGFNEERDTTNNSFKVTLTATSIDAIVNSLDSEFSYVPPDRTLTGVQLLLLASKLKMKYPELEAILDDVIQESEEPNQVKTTMRPYTPGIWSAEFRQNNPVSSETSTEDSSDNVCTTDYSDNDVSNDEEVSIDEVQEEGEVGGWNTAIALELETPRKKKENLWDPTMNAISANSANKINFSTNVIYDNDDGWGKPTDFVPWTDYDRQGFSVDVIKKQNTTKFWNQGEDGWRVLQPPNAQSSPEEDNRRHSTTVTTKTRKSITSTVTNIRPYESSSKSVISTDEAIDWDQEDPVTIITNKLAPLMNKKKTPRRNNSSNTLSDTALACRTWQDFQPKEKRPESRMNSKRYSHKSSLDTLKPQPESQHSPAESKVAASSWTEYQSTDYNTTIPKQNSTDLLVDTSDQHMPETVPTTIITWDLLNSFENINVSNTPPSNEPPDNIPDLFQFANVIPETTTNDAKYNTVNGHHNPLEDTYISDITPIIPTSKQEDLLEPDVLFFDTLSRLTTTLAIKNDSSIEPDNESNSTATYCGSFTGDITHTETIIEQEEKGPPATTDIPSTASRGPNTPICDPANPPTTHDSPSPKKKREYLTRLKVQTEPDVSQYLYLYDDKSPEESVREFCEKYDVSDPHNCILEAAKIRYMKKQTESILGRRKKT